MMSVGVNTGVSGVNGSRMGVGSVCVGRARGLPGWA